MGVPGSDWSPYGTHCYKIRIMDEIKTPGKIYLVFPSHSGVYAPIDRAPETTLALPFLRGGRSE